MSNLIEASSAKPEQSPREPKRSRLIGLAVIASVAALSFYLLLFAVVIAAIGGLVLMISLGRVGVALAVPVGLLLTAARRSLVAAIPHRPQLELYGVAVTASDQRRLWQTVDEISAEVGRGGVDELRLVLGGSASVVERGTGVGTHPHRVLMLPLSYFEVLSRRELQVVIAHELAHLAAGDATLARWLSWLNAVMARTAGRLEGRKSVLRYPFRWHMRLLARAISAFSRRRELAADRVSADLFGASTAAAALRRTQTLEPAFEWYWSELGLVLNEGLRPPIVDGFRSFLGSPAVSESLASLSDEAGALSSHPSLQERLAALDAEDDQEDQRKESSALRLLADLDVLEGSLLEDIAGAQATALTRASWLEASRRVLPGIWREFVEASELANSRANVAGLPQLLMTDSGATSNEPAEHRAAVVSCALMLSLLHGGWTLDRLPGYPSKLSNEGRELVPRDAVHALLAGQMTATDWVEKCHELEIGELELFVRAGVPTEPPCAKATAPPQRAGVAIRARLRERSMTSLQARASVALAVVLAGSLALAALVAPLSSAATPAAHVAVRAMGALIAGALVWLLWRRRSARRDPPSIALDTSGLTLTHRQLLREPLHLPRDMIRVVAVDIGGDGGAPEARFPLFDSSAFSSHALRSKTPRGWIWPVGKGRIPLFSVMRDVPNVLIVLDDAVPGPRVRKEKLHGPLNGERLRALAIRVEELDALRPALRAEGLERDLTLADTAGL